MPDINGTPNNDILAGTVYSEIINGWAGNDRILADDGNDTINGGEGSDYLDGGSGADRFIGELGSDTYIVDNPGDVVVELLNQGTDAVRSNVTYALPAEIEHFHLTGTAAINGTGNNLNNRIQGNSNDNIIWGMAGADQIGGGDGKDILYGGEDDDRLNGELGADQLIGQWGNDLYIVDNPGDVVTELAGEGIDKVNAVTNYTLPAHVENLYFDGPPGSISDPANPSLSFKGWGNNLPNVITGNSANNILDGGIGADTLEGMSGNDVYYVDNPGDIVTEFAGYGTDEVYSTISYTLPAHVENLYLDSQIYNINGTGNVLPNLILGNQFSNVLNGGLGADTLIGGQASDIYEVDNIGDVVIEDSVAGIDRVVSTVTYTLPESADIEEFYLTGTAAINGTGNNVGNTIVGNSANNTLAGGRGFNVLTGNGGADTFLFKFVDSSLSVAGDTITDFTVGTDKIDLLTQGGAAMNAPNSFSRAANDTTSRYVQDIADKVFIDANGELVGNQPLGINSAALVVATNSSYLVINDSTAGFQLSNDLVIRLQTFGLLPPMGAIPVTTFFA
ncbi:calcium-binding protein [Microcoleus sp. Pol7_A1]|uniref:calcium-binding protein n=1 Tax=Microcoleus sp. Pol7_A1 TaxID=2818893 RepID=UPI002FCF7A45